MGGEFLVGLNREVRDAAGVQAGDEAEVTIPTARNTPGGSPRPSGADPAAPIPVQTAASRRVA